MAVIYDAIVSGAGPAGSTTARILARGGASVLLLDRARFPRNKPCGGGVTIRADTEQDLDLSSVVERTIYGARFSLSLGSSFTRWHEKPLTYMTQRCRLDSFLVEESGREGALFHDEEVVRSVDVQDRKITVRTTKDTYSGRTLVAADGANGFVGAATGVRPELEEAVALEGNLPFSPEVPADWREMLALDLGGLAGGYGWVFPKGDHLNLGVGAWKYAASTLRPKLADLASYYGFQLEQLQNLRGHHLPIRVPGSTIARGAVLAVGDAAGLVDPMSGEGIHMAFSSGRLAAREIGRYLSGEIAGLASYQRAVESDLQPELVASRKLQELFHFAPPAYLGLLRSSRRFWKLFCYLIRGEITYKDFLRRLGPLSNLLYLFADVAQRRRLSRIQVLS